MSRWNFKTTPETTQDEIINFIENTIPPEETDERNACFFELSLEWENQQAIKTGEVEDPTQ
tara:strand:- start:3618 stop:3800 length:183 start_codon:yes stop_codon:yes gene_type:complete